jgi:glycosyltransferase involved in cell wall biosynthesis
LEIEKQKILFIAYDCENKAVWNAIKLHVEFAKASQKEISFIADNRYKDIVERDYPNHKVYGYSSLLNLSMQLNRIDAEYIFSPVMFTTLLSFPAKLLSHKKVLYWVQGAVPEESYLRHQSKARYHLLSAIEYLGLRIAHKNIFVSTEMKRALEKKTKQNLDNSIVVPCISEFTYDGSTKERDSFVYIGGMSAWQRVDIMLEMFNEILKEKPQAKLYIATLEQERAKTLIEEYLDNNYQDNIILLSINDRKEIPHFLSTKEYGFLIREDIVVNNVSSPIKLAEYLSCGVNVIISEAVTSYASLIEEHGAGLKISSEDDIITKLKNFRPNTQNAIELYHKHFSKEQHQESYLKLLSSEEQ